MGELIYGEDWIVYTFNDETQNYSLVNYSGNELEAGEAFWIVHIGDAAVELDIPVGLPKAKSVVLPACGSDQGCFPLPLENGPSNPDTDTAQSFHLIGSPFSYNSEVGEVRFVTQPSAAECESGCSLEEAGAAEFSESFFWVYNSSTAEYEQRSTGDEIKPWEGFWFVTLPAAHANSPTLNIPSRASNTPGENMCGVGMTTAEEVVISSIEKPEYLQPYTDPALGASVVRITESSFGQVRKPVYSTIQAWNADESLLFLYKTGQGGAKHILLDGQNYEPVADLDIFPSDIEEIFWSHSDPDTLFYVSRAAADFGEFKRYSVSEGQSTKIADFDGICDSEPMAGEGVDMQSHDDDLFGFRCRQQNGQYIMVSYRISTDETLTAPIGGNSGWYNSTAPNPAPSGERFWYQGVTLGADLNTVEQELDLASSREHSSIGLTHNGQDAFYQTVFDSSPLGCSGDANNGVAHLVQHNLETGACRTFFNQSDGYPYTTSSTHVSAQAYQRPGWVAMSSIGRSSQYQYFSNNQPAPPLFSEIYLANTDPNDPATCRLAHHRSYGKAATKGGYEPYFGEPHATISPSGTRILFGSDWYDSGSVDSYVIELPGFNRRL